MAFTVLALAAVVALLATLLAVEIVASLLSAIAAELEISASTMVRLVISADPISFRVATLPRPRAVRAAAGVVAPVPPLARARVPVTSLLKLIEGPVAAAVSRPWASTVTVARV